MATVTHRHIPVPMSDAGPMMRRLAGTGLLGGLAMILVMGALMSGHATNADVAHLMSMMTPRHAPR
jgi:hypothetical protein